jgi:RNA polymerase sigma factor (sigma-70 family)
MLLQLWRALPSLRDDGSIRTWTFRILHNTGLKHARTGARRIRESGPLLHEPVHPGELPEDAAITSQRREALYSAMRALDPLDAELIALQLEGLDVGQIAEVLGLTPTNTTTRLHRARSHLSALLQEVHRER